MKEFLDFLAEMPEVMKDGLLAIISAGISALIARATAIRVAKEETNRLLLKFEHEREKWSYEKVQEDEREFQDMVADVSQYIPNVHYIVNQVPALESVAKQRTKATGNMAKLLDSLYDAIKNGSSEDVESKLSLVIFEHRKIPSGDTSTQ